MAGITKRHAERRAIDVEQALTLLAKVASEEKLTPADAEIAATYTAAQFTGDCWYQTEALALLVHAGADIDQAGEIAWARTNQRRISFGDAQF